MGEKENREKKLLERENKGKLKINLKLINYFICYFKLTYLILALLYKG